MGGERIYGFCPGCGEDFEQDVKVEAFNPRERKREQIFNRERLQDELCDRL
jgi:hypothetical protein